MIEKLNLLEILKEASKLPEEDKTPYIAISVECKINEIIDALNELKEDQEYQDKADAAFNDYTNNK